MITGLIMVAVMNYMPLGMADTAILWSKRFSATRKTKPEGQPYVSSGA